MRLSYFFIVALLTFHVSLWGQNGANLMNLTPISPTASSLGKYGSIPVSTYTGTPNISIPLHSINLNTFSLPISLSYHAGGHRLDEIGGWCGLGWSLSAGGVITRSVRGIPDDSKYGHFSMANRQKNQEYISYAQSNGSYNNTLFSISGAIPGSFLWDMDNQHADIEPDLFHFNFAGYSGKFISDGEESTVDSKAKLEVRYIYPTNSWQIKDISGNTYFFGYKEYSNDTLKIGNPYEQDWQTPSAWMLTRIVTVNREIIDFSYSNYIHTPPIPAAQYISRCDLRTQSSPNQILQKMSVSGLRLSEISFHEGEGKIKFYESDRNDFPPKTVNTEGKLDKIEVVYKYNVVKSYKFIYDGNNINDRLTLKEVYQVDKLGNNLPAHKFSYHSVKLPPTSFLYPINDQTSKRDNWGFFNDRGIKNRSVNVNTVMANMLTKIEYPTGGKTEFTYESHQVTPETVPAQSVIDNCINTDFNSQQYVEGTPGNSLAWVNTKEISISEKSCFDIVSDIKVVQWGYPEQYAFTQIRKDDPINGQVVWHRRCYGANSSSTLQPSCPENIKQEFIILEPGTYYLQAYGLIYPIYSSYPVNHAKITVRWKSNGLSANGGYYVGGCRIKEMKDYDGLGNLPTIKQYNYFMYDSTKNKTTISGRLLSLPVYNYNKKFIRLGNYGIGCCNTLYRFPEVCEANQYDNFQTQVPLLTTFGSHVGYAEVRIYDGLDGKNGMEIQKFTSSIEYPDAVVYEYPFPPPTTYDWIRGLLKEHLIYKKHPVFNQQLIKRQLNSYDLIGSASKMCIGYRTADNLDWAKPITCLGGQCYDEYHTARLGHIYSYNFNSGTVSKVKSEDWIYETAGNNSYVSNLKYVVSKSEVQYNLHNNIIKTEENNSKNQKEYILRTYPKDYSYGNDDFAWGIVLLDLRNILGAVIEEIKIREVNDVPYVIAAQLNEYHRDKPLLKAIWLLEIPEPIKLTEFERSCVRDISFIKDDRYVKRVIFETYDSKGNLLQQRKLDGTPQSYMYNDMNLVKSEIIGATIQQVQYIDGEEVFLPNRVFSNVTGIPAKSGNAYLQGDYTTTFIKPDNNKYSISYWYLENSVWKYDVLPYENGIIISKGDAIDEVRIYPEGALMTTATYDPLIGKTSETDTNGVTTYYEYDAANRLKFIKDQDKNIIQRFTYKYAE